MPSISEQKKPEARRDIFAELGLADDDDKVKIQEYAGSLSEMLRRDEEYCRRREDQPEA